MRMRQRAASCGSRTSRLSRTGSRINCKVGAGGVPIHLLPLPVASQSGFTLKKAAALSRFSPSSFFVSPETQSDTDGGFTPHARASLACHPRGRSADNPAILFASVGIPKSSQKNCKDGLLTSLLVSPNIRLMNTTAIKVIDALGGTYAVARLCGIQPPSVSEWKKNGIPKPWLMFFEQRNPELFKKAA